MVDKELDEVVASLNGRQYEDLKKYLDYMLCPDDEEDAEVAAQKRDAYSAYKNKISDLIAKVEVYAHDLPFSIHGIIERIVQMHSLAELTEDRDQKIERYKAIIQYEDFLVNILHLMLTNLYVSQIKAYIKILKRFNYKAEGVCEGDSPVLCNVEKNVKHIKCLVRQCKKKLKEVYSISSPQIEMFVGNVPAFLEKLVDREAEVRIGSSEEISDLKAAVDEAQDTLKRCEKIFPDIVNNGYNESLLKRFWNAVPAIISFILALYGLIVLLGV